MTQSAINLECFAGMAWHCTTEGIYLEMNRAWSEFIGFDDESVQFNQWFNHVHPDDLPQIRLIHQSATTHQSGYQVKCRYQRSTHTYAWIIATAVPVKSQQNELSGFIVSAIDISDNGKGFMPGLPNDPKLIRQEFNHRLKNQLSEIEALTDFYTSSTNSASHISSAIRGQVSAIRSVHSLLSQADSNLVCFLDLTDDLVNATCRLWNHKGGSPRNQIRLDGPGFRLPAKYASSVAICLHELLANSRKHGALKTDGGTAQLRWEISKKHEGSATVKMIWEESTYSPSTKTLQQGIGLRLVEGLTTSELQGQYEAKLQKDGFICTLTTRIADLTTSPA